MSGLHFRDLRPGDMFEVMCFDVEPEHDHCFVLCLWHVRDEAGKGMGSGWLTVGYVNQHGRIHEVRFYSSSRLHTIRHSSDNE